MSSDNERAGPDLNRRARINRVLVFAAIAFLALGVATNQFFVTWLNATLL